MQPWLEALEGTGPAEALRASFVAYPLVNAAHILAIGALVTAVLLLDIRTLGGFRAQPADRFLPLMRHVALGAFAGALATGFALFAVQATAYAENPAFLAKMALLALAGLNFLVLARAGGAQAEAWGTRLAALVSLVLWPLVLVAGRFIGFV